jgi:hypothetical protein
MRTSRLRRLRALHFRLPRGNGLRPCSNEYVGKLGLCDSLGRPHLFEFGDSLRIIDPYEHRPRRDVLAPVDRDLLDPSVDARGFVEAGRIGLALNEKWFRSQEIEERKRNNYCCDRADDDGRTARRGGRALLLSVTWCVGRTLNFSTRGRHVHA